MSIPPSSLTGSQLLPTFAGGALGSESLPASNSLRFDSIASTGFSSHIGGAPFFVGTGLSFQSWLQSCELGSDDSVFPATSAKCALIAASLDALDGIYAAAVSLAGASIPQFLAAAGAGANQSSSKVHMGTADSGSEVHLLTLEAAYDLFRDIGESNFRIVGITGVPSKADITGQLIVDLLHPSSGQLYRVDFGAGHGMKDCPMNLLSVSLLLDIGAVLHFEADNCYIQPPKSSERIPLSRRGGLFQFPLRQALGADEVPPSDSEYSFAVNGWSLLAGDLKLWHRRNRHIPLETLRRIHIENLVDGFNLTGSHNTDCACWTCAQTKLKRRGVPRDKPYGDTATFIGHTVSTDVKEVPYVSIHGYRYVVNFVDHFSRVGLCFFMRTKDEVVDKAKLYVAEMARYGVKIRTIQSDRGSEYYAQEGATRDDRDRALAVLDRFLAQPDINIRHVVTPVEMKERLAEVWFRDHFLAADAMLWEARLSPVFWCDAIAYSQYLFNRTPNAHIGPTTPWSMLSGERARWDRFRVFGSDCYRHRPNNAYAKVPGLPVGQKLIFVGFDSAASGYRVFDPETRNYFSTDNLYFYENFSHRIDALRHHDKRRELLRRGEDQPYIVDDFTDENADAVRNLYLDPDALAPQGDARLLPSLSTPGDATTSPAPILEGATSALPASNLEGARNSSTNGPLSTRSISAELTRGILRQGVIIRPLRLLPVGREASYTPEDHRFLRAMELTSAPIVYQSPCPKKQQHSECRRRYLKYMHATSIIEALELGSTREDLKHDYRHGYLRFPKNESDLPGHIFAAFDFAASNGYTHVLQDVGRRVMRKSFDNETVLAGVFNASQTESHHPARSFHQVLETVYEPEVIVEQLANRELSLRWAEHQMAKVFNSTEAKIDFALAPEPVRYEQTLPEHSMEHALWKAAMDDEMYSMARFEVYRRVPKSAASGRQILGCRWVYKRKFGKNGTITRYRARLVAQGFLQRPFDSFNPDEIFSPVVHKDTLRLFLSVCAAQNLQIFQADVKAAFLQAPLSDRIFMRAPPGYGSVGPDGQEEILELSRAIYGLKQSSAAFWSAMHEHLTSKGFVPLLGDPCLFRKVLPNGKTILVCTYIDDVTYAVSDQATADHFLAELRTRFVIEEGEGKPVDWLLGMAISQDLEAGTVHVNMETAITKLAQGILTPEELVKSRSVRTPMLVTPLKKQSTRTVSAEAFDYLSVVGSLLHVANCVRCDVALSVGILSRHAACPGPAHVTAAKRVVQYLYNTRSLGLTYRRQANLLKTNVPLMYERGQHHQADTGNVPQFFADSDYAADETRRSTMGIVTMLNGGPISWTSTLGKTVALSTCEAEVMAACSAARDALHISRMLQDLQLVPLNYTLQIAEDNSACISQAHAGIRHIRNAKHYEVKLRFLQDLVVQKQIEFVYCPTDEQLADFFTKPLEEEKFTFFRDRIMSSN